MKGVRFALILAIFNIFLMANIVAADVENMIINPEFDKGIQEWQLEIHADFVNAKLEWDNWEGVIDKKSAYVNIMDIKPGTEAWRLQFKQTNHKVKQGQKYTWTFWAKSTVKLRSASLWVGMEVDPWAGLGGSKAILITDEWKEFQLTFTATQNFDNTRLSIQLADSTAPVWIDHVRFYEGDYVEDPDINIIQDPDPVTKKGENMIINPEFELGTTGWNLEVHGDYVKASMIIDKILAIGDRACMRINIDDIKAGSEVWRLQFKQVGISITGGKTYTWSFWAKAADYRPMTVWVGMETDPWATLGASEAIELMEIDWTEYHFTFLASDSFDNTRLSIQLAGAKETVWVDHVRFYEGKYEEEDYKEIMKQRSVSPAGKLTSKWGKIKSGI